MSIFVTISVVRKNNNEIDECSKGIIPYHTQADEDCSNFTGSFVYDEVGRNDIVELFDFISTSMTGMETSISERVSKTRNYLNGLVMASGGTVNMLEQEK